MSTITYEQARRAVDASLQRAKEIGVPMCVAVLDSGRNLVLFARQDGALLVSIEIAVAKAQTSVAVRMATKDVRELVAPGQHLYGLEMLSGGKYATWVGGRPVTLGGEMIGAIGASGGTDEQDEEVALAGLAALGSS